MGSLILGLRETRHRQRWARVRMRGILRGADPNVQGLLQAHGHQQGWHPGQKRPPWRLRQRRVLMTEGELDGLLGEISGPCTFDNMVKMFQEKMAGEGNDSDDLIVQAFKAYDM